MESINNKAAVICHGTVRSRGWHSPVTCLGYM